MKHAEAKRRLPEPPWFERTEKMVVKESECAELVVPFVGGQSVGYAW